MRLANVGRALLMGAGVDAANVWQSGVHLRGLLIGGVGTFVAVLAMFEGFDRWDKRRRDGRSDPPPPLPTGAPGFGQPSSGGAEGSKVDT